MGKEQLHRYIEESKGNERNVCQIYVVKDGMAIYDDCWRGFRTEDAANVNSVTKGVMALLAGIAIDKGYISGADQKVMDFFPGYKLPAGEQIVRLSHS